MNQELKLKKTTKKSKGCRWSGEGGQKCRGGGGCEPRIKVILKIPKKSGVGGCVGGDRYEPRIEVILKCIKSRGGGGGSGVKDGTKY